MGINYDSSICWHADHSDLACGCRFTDEAVVSTDFITDDRSSVVDASAGIQLSPTFVKVQCPGHSMLPQHATSDMLPS